MVGTTRFELATSPTPRVRSTRLSHVPTLFASRRPFRADSVGYLQPLVYTRRWLPNRVLAGLLSQLHRAKQPLSAAEAY